MSSNRAVELAYDETPYPSTPHVYSHPSLMGAQAICRGFRPPALDRCRVLELGGSDGGNLLPMALDYPDSEFVCLDISSVQIEMGREFARELGLSNLSFHAADLAAIDESEFGKFDYILAHGVFSWVNPETQKSLIRLYQRLLSDDGLGYISYNVYPGWHVNLSLREMVLKHSEGMESARDRLTAAAQLIQQMANIGQEKEPFITARSLLNSMSEMETPDTYLTHEYLSQDNRPMYFSEFVEMLEEASLKWVAEMRSDSQSIAQLPQDTQQWISEHCQSEVEVQQYLDYFTNANFRRSIITRAGRDPENSDLNDLFVAGKLTKVEGEDGRWLLETGKTFSTTHPQAQQVLELIYQQSPLGITSATIAEQTSLPLEAVSQMVSAFVEHDVVELRTSQINAVNTCSETPIASPLARYQVQSGYLTSQRHRRVRMDNQEAMKLIPLLDGSRTIQQLVTETGIAAEQINNHLSKLVKLGIVSG